MRCATTFPCDCVKWACVCVRVYLCVHNVPLFTQRNKMSFIRNEIQPPNAHHISPCVLGLWMCRSAPVVCTLLQRICIFQRPVCVCFAVYLLAIFVFYDLFPKCVVQAKRWLKWIELWAITAEKIDDIRFLIAHLRCLILSF